MDPIEKRELKRQAWMRLAAQKHRAGLLRGRVVVISLICFAVLWGIVFVQMATGHDPVLSAKEPPTSGRATAGMKRKRPNHKKTQLELGPEVTATSEVVEPEAELEELVPEKEVEPEFEEAEPEFVEEPLVTSQS